MTVPAQRLFDAPLSGLFPISVHEANDFLEAVGHKLGKVNRPFHQEAFGLEVDGRVIAVVTSGTIVNGPVAGYERHEVVELTRLGASVPWANRVMLRLWREVCAPSFRCPSPGRYPLAAVSYSANALHRGDIYRFDGWEKVREDAGAGKTPSSWGRRRDEPYPWAGKKTLWVWRYEGPMGMAQRSAGKKGKPHV